MNQLIPVQVNDKQEQILSGRALHDFLGICTPYTQWFSRIREYGFEENADYFPYSQKSESGGASGIKVILDHLIKLDMAKEICMLQRSEKGKQARQYFIQIEKDWNSPEKTMARALLLANKKIKELNTLNAQKTQLINELQPKSSYYDLILQNKSLLSITQIGKDYGKSGKEINKILHKLGIQYKQGGTWLLYQKYADKGYTQSKTHIIDDCAAKFHTYWTQKGRLFIYETLKREGILPLIEMQEKTMQEKF